MKFRTTIAAVALGAALTTGALFVDMAHADNGYEAATASECEAPYTSFETFEDGSSGCYLPGSGEWAPCEFEVAMMSDPDYAGEEWPEEWLECLPKQPAKQPVVPKHEEPRKSVRPVQPGLPSTGN